MNRTEAIKKIRQMSLPKETMEILEALAPELKENEDERIRKAMLQHFKNKTKEKWCNIPVKDIISWFEKQDHDGKKWITPAELNRLETLRYEAGFDDGVRSEMKKQKEQKSAEWSNVDEIRLDEAIEMIEANGSWVRSDDAVKLVSDWLKALPERFNLTPKQEWSEEDEYKLEQCIRIVSVGREIMIL